MRSQVRRSARLLLASVLAAFFAPPVLGAQTDPADAASEPPALGLLGGFSSAKLLASGSGASVTFDARSGLVFGGSLTKRVTPAVSVEVDGLYVQKGFDASDGGTAAFIHVDYLEVPVLLRFGLGSEETRPFLAGGGSMAVRVGCTAGVSDGGTSRQGTCGSEATRQWDYGLLLGGGLDLGRLSGSVRYTFGLADVLEVSGTATRNRFLSVILGYRLSGS